MSRHAQGRTKLCALRHVTHPRSCGVKIFFVRGLAIARRHHNATCLTLAWARVRGEWIARWHQEAVILGTRAMLGKEKQRLGRKRWLLKTTPMIHGGYCLIPARHTYQAYTRQMDQHAVVAVLSSKPGLSGQGRCCDPLRFKSSTRIGREHEPLHSLLHLPIFLNYPPKERFERR